MTGACGGGGAPISKGEEASLFPWPWRAVAPPASVNHSRVGEEALGTVVVTGIYVGREKPHLEMALAVSRCPASQGEVNQIFRCFILSPVHRRVALSS